jgi:hypothetical protein
MSRQPYNIGNERIDIKDQIVVDRKVHKLKNPNGIKVSPGHVRIVLDFFTDDYTPPTKGKK